MTDDLQDRINDLEGKVEALHNARKYLLEKTEELEAENEYLREEFDDLRSHVKRVDATMPTKQKSKLQKFVNIIEAAERADRGLVGAILTYSEVMAAASCSKQHAHTLMDEFAAKFEWADKEAPPGKRKKLRVKFGDRQPADLVADVEDAFATEGEPA